MIQARSREWAREERATKHTCRRVEAEISGMSR
jgi:hypothetical protein